MSRIEERAAWCTYEQEAKRSARFEFLAKSCFMATMIALGLIPVRAVLPAYAAKLVTLPKSDAGALKAVWLLSQEAVLPASLFLILAVIFANRIVTRD